MFFAIAVLLLCIPCDAAEEEFLESLGPYDLDGPGSGSGSGSGPAATKYFCDDANESMEHGCKSTAGHKPTKTFSSLAECSRHCKTTNDHGGKGKGDKDKDDKDEGAVVAVVVVALAALVCVVRASACVRCHDLFAFPVC